AGAAGRRQRGADRAADLHALRVRLRGDLRAADHRRARRDRAGAPGAHRAQADAEGSFAGEVPRLRREGPDPDPAAGPRHLRPAQRDRHAGAAARRHGVGAVGPPVPGPRRGRRLGGRAGPRGRTRPARGREGERRMTTHYLVLSALLFAIGAIGVLVRRNAIVVFMCVELMLNACNLAFVTFARQHGNLDGQIIAFFVMVVAAAEVVVGLAIIVTMFRTRRSASVDDANLLKN